MLLNLITVAAGAVVNQGARNFYAFFLTENNLILVRQNLDTESNP